MNPRSHRRAAVLGALGLAVAAPLFTVSIATAHPSEAAPPPPSRSVIFGTDSETGVVTVYRQPLPQGAPEVLFTYESPHTDHDHGAGVPELALSADGRAVTYLARSGLRERDLGTGADEVVIGRSERPSGGMEPASPVWSVPELNGPASKDPHDSMAGMLGLGDLAFSPDGRFLSFDGYWFEYTDHWVFELSTGRHWNQPRSLQLAWGPTSDRVAVVGAWAQGPGHLAISAPADYGTFQRITPAPDPKPEVVSYVDAVFAPAGDRIAFTYTTELGFPVRHLASSALDGSGFKEIDGEGAKENAALAWDPTFDVLYWVEREGDKGTIEVQYQKSGGRTTFDLPRDLISVTKMWVASGGQLVLVGTTNDLIDGVHAHRLVVIGPDGHQLAASPPFSQSTTFIGIV